MSNPTNKQLYVLLDEEQDIVETFPENFNFDHLFQYKQSYCPNGTIHKATIVIGPQQHENIHLNLKQARPAKSIKT